MMWFKMLQMLLGMQPNPELVRRTETLVERSTHGEVVLQKMKEENEKAANNLRVAVNEFLDLNDKLRFKGDHGRNSQK